MNNIQHVYLPLKMIDVSLRAAYIARDSRQATHVSFSLSDQAMDFTSMNDFTSAAPTRTKGDKSLVAQWKWVMQGIKDPCVYMARDASHPLMASSIRIDECAIAIQPTRLESQICKSRDRLFVHGIPQLTSS